MLKLMKHQSKVLEESKDNSEDEQTQDNAEDKEK